MKKQKLSQKTHKSYTPKKILMSSQKPFWEQESVFNGRLDVTRFAAVEIWSLANMTSHLDDHRFNKWTDAAEACRSSLKNVYSLVENWTMTQSFDIRLNKSNPGKSLENPVRSGPLSFSVSDILCFDVFTALWLSWGSKFFEAALK